MVNGPEWENRQSLYSSLSLVGRELFKNPQIINGIWDLEPLPSEYPNLIILRANEESPAQGFLLRLPVPLKELKKESGDSVGVLFENLCTSSDCSPEDVDGVVVFMAPEVTLWSMGRDFRVMIGQLPPEARLWFIEPHTLVGLNRREKEIRREYLRFTLDLVDCKSVRAKSGLCYSTGRKRIKKEIKEPLLAQPELFA